MNQTSKIENFDNMVRKRTLSSVLDENPTTTRSPRVTIRSIVQPGNRNKVPCYCSTCKGMLVYPRVKNRHELLEAASLNVSEVINELTEALENSEIQDNELSEDLENIENIDDESSQLATLNEQKVDEGQQINLLTWKRGSRSILTSGNIRQDLPLRESTVEDQSNELDEGNELNKDNELENNNSDEDDELENNNSANFEDYSCPPFEPYQDLNVNPTHNEILWILL